MSVHWQRQWEMNVQICGYIPPVSIGERVYIQWLDCFVSIGHYNWQKWWTQMRVIDEKSFPVRREMIYSFLHLLVVPCNYLLMCIKSMSNMLLFSVNFIMGGGLLSVVYVVNVCGTFNCHLVPSYPLCKLSDSLLTKTPAPNLWRPTTCFMQQGNNHRHMKTRKHTIIFYITADRMCERERKRERERGGAERRRDRGLCRSS